MSENNYLDLEKAEYKSMIQPYGNSYNPKSWKPVLDFVIQWLHENKEELKNPEREIPGVLARFIYYRIIEEAGIKLPLTNDAYQSYIKIQARAKKDHDNEKYDIIRELVFDDTRNRTIEHFYGWQPVTEEDLELYIKTSLTESRRVYPYDKYVEMWFEDNGHYQMYRHIPKRYRISTECIGGNLITNSVYGLIRRIRRKTAENEFNKIIILYCGDYNPSGNHRIHLLQTVLADFGINAVVHKVLITKPQIKKYKILPDFDSLTTQERIEKAKRDPLQRWFIEKYGSNVYDVNAQALNLDLTEKLITTAIEHFVDVSVLDDLDESHPIDYEFGWDEDRYYIKLPDGRLT